MGGKRWLKSVRCHVQNWQYFLSNLIGVYTNRWRIELRAYCSNDDRDPRIVSGQTTSMMFAEKCSVLEPRLALSSAYNFCGLRAVRRKRKTSRSFVFRSASAIKSNCAREIGRDVVAEAVRDVEAAPENAHSQWRTGCSFPAVGWPRTRNE